jgi:taurine dioxygenase
MRYHSIQVEALTPHVGCEIHNVDLSQPLDEQTFQEIHAALIEHGVIFFRDQQLTPEQQKAFGRRFGELLVNPASPAVLDGHPELQLVHADEKSTFITGGGWHSDASWLAEPAMGTVLYMHEIPAVGGDTLFASMYAAHDALSGPMKRLLEGLTAVHELAQVVRARPVNTDQKMVMPKAEHPVIRTHPISGRRALFVNRGFTSRIVQLEPVESDALLQFLFRHVETPEFHCRFRWRARSLAFWDNRAVQHHALWDYRPQRRHAHRLAIKGDKPFCRV